jgi:hypothetical protein
LAEGDFFMEGQKRVVVTDAAALASAALDGLEQVAELVTLVLLVKWWCLG